MKKSIQFHDGGECLGRSHPTPPFGRRHLTCLLASFGAAMLLAASPAHAGGTVIAWGYNSNGQTNVPAGLTNVVTVAAGGCDSLALRADGTVAEWGYNGNGQTNVPSGLSNVVAVAASGDWNSGGHSLALRSDGTVAAWGNNDNGQTTVPAGLSNVVAVAAGMAHSLALRADGSVVAWGSQTTVPAGLSNVVAVAGGGGHSLALRADGTVAAWGQNNRGQATVPPGLSNVVAVAAGSSHSLALRTNGTVAAWGDNGDGQTTVPAGLSNVVAVAAGGWFSLALRADGTVAAWGLNDRRQTTVPAGLSNVVAVSAGGSHSLALSGSLAPFLNRPLFAQTVFAGATASFGMGVTASRPYFYQWQMNGTNLPGATNNYLVLTNVVLSQSGDYSVVVSNNAGTVTSSNALLTVVPLIITTQPQSQTVLASDTASFGVSCQSILPLTYQWQMNGTNLSGATTNPLVLTNVTLSQAGSYSVIVSNSAGTVTSSNALLTVTPLIITTQPQSQTVLASDTASFGVSCQSILPLTYQWRMNGTNLPWATTNSLALTNVALSQAGSYSVIVSNSAGTVASSNALLTVVPLTITTQPQSQPAFLGGSASFSVECESVLPLSYQWRLSGTNLPGATGNPLVLTNLALNQAGNYTVVVSNSSGSVISAKAVLTFVPLAAWGRNSDGQTNVPAGLSNVVMVAGGAGHSLALRADGTVAAWGWNGYGQTNVPAGLNNVIAVAARGNNSLALRADGTVVAWGNNNYGQTNVPVGLSNVVGIAAGTYHSVALGVDGTVAAWGNNNYGQSHVPLGLDNVASVVAGGGHSLALRADGSVVAWGNNNYGQTDVPEDLNDAVTMAAGESHNLAIRSDHPMITWGNNNRGQTNIPQGASYVSAVAGGDYHSLALGRSGSVTAWGHNSDGQTNVPSFVTVAGGIACGGYHSLAVPSAGPPFITSRLANRAQRPGGTVFFGVKANGARPLFYQWQRYGVDLPGKTNALLKLTALAPGDAGDYSVIVSNALGVATIPSAHLTVALPPLEAALNISLPWELGGDSAWFAQTNVTHDGVSAAQSGPIADNQESWLETSVVGPGTLFYWWKVSSEQDYDFLKFYLDGVLQASISGEVPWQKQTYSIPAGTHTLRWRYVKDVSGSDGQDAGWLDEVYFPTVPLQFAGGASLSVSNGTLNMLLTGSAGASVVVESSLDLMTWTPVQTNTLPYGGLNLAMPVGTNGLQFFRARIP